jgi:sulfur dioxygenase
MIFKQLFDHKSSTYTYLIASSRGREALILDPVLENVEEYIKLFNELDLKLVKVIDTHIHADHITGASKLKDRTKCTTIMGENTPANSVEIKVKDEEIIKLDQLKIKALYTPGHTSDSYSFLMDNYLFSGDTLLINGTGRTDFQNGSSKDAYNSIFNKLLKLPEETFLYPAHDYKGEKVSTIGKEKKQNPRLQVNSVDEYIDIMNNLNLKKPAKIETNISRNINLGAQVQIKEFEDS